jgi:hypothetical protein
VTALIIFRGFALLREKTYFPQSLTRARSRFERAPPVRLQFPPRFRRFFYFQRSLYRFYSSNCSLSGHCSNLKKACNSAQKGIECLAFTVNFLQGDFYR